jgi:hypothetical protein
MSKQLLWWDHQTLEQRSNVKSAKGTLHKVYVAYPGRLEGSFNVRGVRTETVFPFKQPRSCK